MAIQATIAQDLGNSAADLGSDGQIGGSDGSNEAPPPPSSLLNGNLPDVPSADVPNINKGDGDAKISIDDFGKVLGDSKLKSLKKDDVVAKPADDKKVEVKTTEPNPAVEKKVVTQPQGRNYDELKTFGLDDASIALHKKMSNDVYDFVVARYKDLQTKSNRVKELETVVSQKKEGDLPSTYYEHPEAYVLDPKYNAAVDGLRGMQEAKQYWQEQFALIRSGDNWKNIVPDGKGGFVAREEKPGGHAESIVLSNINQCDHELNRLNGEVVGLKNGFKSRHEELQRGIKNYEDQFFPELKDPEVLKTNQYYNAIIEAFRGTGMGHIPTNSLFAKLYATHMDVLTKYKQLRAEKDGAKAIVDTKKLAGPTGNDTAGGGIPRNGDDVLSMDEFAAVKRRI